MYIFYDFETSSRDLLGQILSYAFVLVDAHYCIQKELCGLIKLNRTQLPEVEALLVNRLDLEVLQRTGDSEYDAAKKIWQFLNEAITQYGVCTLAGYNTNKFDLNFLRNLLIHYGVNPYFSGQLLNKDVLHFAQHAAFMNEADFPWVLAYKEEKPYYSFSLENLTSELGLLTKPQTHGARDDVLLTLALVQELERRFRLSFQNFRPIALVFNQESQLPFEYAKQKVLCYGSMEKYEYRYWLKLFPSGKGFVLLDLAKYADLNQPTPTDRLSCLRYINPNKHFFILESLEPEEGMLWQPVMEVAGGDAFLTTLTASRYFELIKKDWDIDYQIHEMGFERIETLRTLVQDFFKNPDHYYETVKTLWKNRREAKDIYLIQLYNRLYLNGHPAPKAELLQRYIYPRYVVGTMLKDKESFVSLTERETRLQALLAQASPEDQPILQAFERYFTSFVQSR